jgi:hypothetical protein
MCPIFILLGVPEEIKLLFFLPALSVLQYQQLNGSFRLQLLQFAK